MRGGTVLYFFGSPAGGFQSQGLRLEMNRTVSLGGGRVPRSFPFGQLADLRQGAVAADIQALGSLPFRGGTGTVAFDGRQVQSTLSFSFAGQLPGGGNGSAQLQISHVFNVDGATGSLLGGGSTMTGSGTTRSGTIAFTGNSTVRPR